MEFTKEQIETRKKEILERLEELKSYLGQELYNEFLEDITDEYIVEILTKEVLVEQSTDEDTIFTLSKEEYEAYMKKTCGCNGRTIIHE